MSILSISRIKVLREAVEGENISMNELLEIQAAFDMIPDEDLPESRENALAADMLNELENYVSSLEYAIYDYVCEHFGESEADDPSWDISQLSNALERKFEVKEK